MANSSSGFGLARLRGAYVRFRRAALYRRVLRPPAPLLILRYHAIGEPAAVGRYVNPSLALSPTRFREQVRSLARRFRLIVPDEIPDVLLFRDKKQRLAVVITFDDGYIDNYEIATPILVEERARGAFYIATQPLRPGAWLWTSELWRVLPQLPAGDLVLPHGTSLALPAARIERQKVGRRLTVQLSAMSADRREDVLEALWDRAGVPRGEGLEGTFVTPRHVQDMRAAGMTIGAHTRSHPQLDLLAANHHDTELQGSKTDLEAILGEPVQHLAYPNPGGNGSIEAPVRASAARCGFRTAVTSVIGPVEPGVDRLRLPRVGIYAGEQEQQFFAALQRVH